MTATFYLTLVLALLVLEYLLDTLTDLLDLRHFHEELPEEFKGFYDQEKYRTALHYQRDWMIFDTIKRTFLITVTIAFLLLGGFSAADQLARAGSSRSVITGVLFAGILAALRFIVQLPFSVYATFEIEKKYGFNKTTVKTYVLDIFKAGLIIAVIGGPAFALIVTLFEKAGSNAWLYCWFVITAFQLLLLYLAPAVIMPLFNKFTPLPDGELKRAIEGYFQNRKFKLKGIYTMDGSRRSTKANAFFTGFGKFRRLVLFDTLIEKHTTDELIAVLAHEVGHFERKHIIKFTTISILTTGFMFYFFSFLIANPELSSAFKLAQPSIYSSLIFIGFLYSPLSRLLSILVNMLSRKFEYEADEFSARTSGHPEILATALKKLSVDNLSHLTPHPLKVLLEYSHPPVLKRIEALRSPRT
ncbi:MAG: peptidase M48 [Bdellovibrionales bacterium RIFOXYC1_FULL_54_43]|nr:MAG: peptidase M48 [Bdellovibrionales bacterium RIFOXYC1_FULL_54_43]OFZ80404.1 MAG: peptidase M48 [Bdellovibrionales bacterium RIFOXYD1_FULL_55_31]